MNPWKLVPSALFVVGGFIALSPSLNAQPIVGGVTTVALNAGTVGALTGLGFGITPIAPSTLTGLDATFPILREGDLSAGLIYHSGGLAFTKGGKTTDIGDFIINLTTDKITGSVNGSASTTTPFFDIGAGDVLTLDPTLAAALVSIYSVPNLSGTTIGVATVNVTLAPEPGSAMLSGLAALGGLALLRRRKAQLAA